MLATNQKKPMNERLDRLLESIRMKWIRLKAGAEANLVSNESVFDWASRDWITISNDVVMKRVKYPAGEEEGGG